MATASQEVPVVNAPVKLSYPFAPRTTADYVVYGIALYTTFAAMGRYGFLGFLVCGLVTLWAIWPKQYAKRYYTIWEDTVVRWWILVVMEGYLWENKAHPDYVPRHVVWWKRALLWLIRIKHPYPFHVDWLGRLGLVHCSSDSSDNLVIYSSGSQISAKSLDDQDHLVGLIADEIERMAYYKGISAKVSHVIKRRPADTAAFGENLDNSVQGDVLVPKALLKMGNVLQGFGPDTTTEQRRKVLRDTSTQLYNDGVLTNEEIGDFRSYLRTLEARDRVQSTSFDVTMTAVITLRRSKRLLQASKSKKPLEQSEVQRQEIVKLATMFCQQLEVATVFKPTILDKDGCEDYLAAALRSVELEDYRASVLSDEPEQFGVPRYHPQKSIRVTDDLCVIDDTGHAVVKLTKLPPHLMAGEAVQLFTAVRDVRWLTRTLTGESSTGKKEYGLFTFFGLALQDIVSYFGLRLGKKTEMRQVGLENRQQALAEAGHVEYINGYEAIASDEPQEIEDGLVEIDRAIRKFRGAGLRVTGAARMTKATYTAQIGIPLL